MKTEESNQGSGARMWQRARDQAYTLYAWHRHHRLGLPEEGLRGAYIRAHPGIEDRWMWEESVLALVFWHTARGRDLSVTDITIADAVSTVGRITLADLAADRLPTAATEFPTACQLPDALEGVTGLLRTHASEPGPERTVGYIVRDLRAAPARFGDHEHGGWADGHQLLQQFLKHGQQQLREGTWAVGPEDRRAAAAAGLDSPPAYDYPVTPAPGDPAHPSWLQRAHHLASLSVSLSTVAATVPRTAQGFDAPLAMVLIAAAGIGSDVRAPVADLDPVWAETPLSSPEWERKHVPASLQELVDAAERAADDLARFLAALAASE
ncbi:hypothetical protein ACIOJD_33965 [Streptomyces sp. NPDC088116]|uniref:hypothetical protein n=1 Tax=Streptomyces sp. NPDC088116 TaxID=3365825 RepID=UPI0037FB26DF